LAAYSTGMDAMNIISRWPSRKALAADMGEPITTIHMWAHRNSIAGKFDVKLVSAAKRRGIYLTYEELAQTRCAPDAVPIEAGT